MAVLGRKLIGDKVTLMPRLPEHIPIIYHWRRDYRAGYLYECPADHPVFIDIRVESPGQLLNSKAASATLIGGFMAKVRCEAS